jgi:hypothetical protein
LVESCEKSTHPLGATAYHEVHTIFSTGTPEYKAFGDIPTLSMGGREMCRIPWRGVIEYQDCSGQLSAMEENDDSTSPIKYSKD